MNPDEVATEIDRLARECGEDPFELFRAATSGEWIVIDMKNDHVIEKIERMINPLHPAEMAQIDRIVFNNATGQK
jgi:hypothetical protein